MSRRRKADKREILPDTRFNDKVLSKFVNVIMVDGKKSLAENVVYKALDIATETIPSPRSSSHKGSPSPVS